MTSMRFQHITKMYGSGGIVWDWLFVWHEHGDGIVAEGKLYVGYREEGGHDGIRIQWYGWGRLETEECWQLSFNFRS